MKAKALKPALKLMKKQYLSHGFYKSSLILFVLLLCSTHLVFSQQNDISIIWSGSSLCTQDGLNGDTTPPVPDEDFTENGCITICEGMPLAFIVEDPLNLIEIYAWESVADGQIILTSSQQSFSASFQNAGGTGAVKLELTLFSGEILTYQYCIDILTSPSAEIGLPGYYEFCEGDIAFKNLSSDNGGSPLDSYLWTFTNPNTSISQHSQEFEPHLYLDPGFYDVVLEVVNECGCRDMTYTEIFVNDSALAIECPSVVCEGEIASYSLSDPDQICSGYSWEAVDGVVQGLALDPNISITWSDIDKDGFGTVSFNAENCISCPNSQVQVSIPIISNDVQLVGPDTICTDATATYAAPRWPGTAFEWTVQDANGSTINSAGLLSVTDQPNEIALNLSGFSSGTYTLHCVYQMPLKGCGGISSKTIEVATPTVIQNSDQTILCIDEVYTWDTETSDPGTSWEIYDFLGFYDQLTGSQLSGYSFSNAGTYYITAQRPDGCMSDPLEVVVNALPDQVSSIDGKLEEVCENVPYTYSATPSDPSNWFKWEVTRGII